MTTTINSTRRRKFTESPDAIMACQGESGLARTLEGVARWVD